MGPVRSQLALITLAVLAGNYARTALGPLQEAMRVALKLTDNQIALLQGMALAIPLIAASVPLGLLIDRTSRSRLMLWLSIANILGTVLTALAGSFVLLLVMRCLIGLTGPATAIVALSLVSDLFPPAQRGRAIMLIGLSQMLGMAVVFGLGGILLAVAGGSGGWRIALLQLSVPLVLSTLAITTIHEPVRRDTDAVEETRPSILAAYARLGSRLAPLLCGIIAIETTLGAVLIWAAPTLARSFALEPDVVGTLIAAGLIISGLVGPVAGGFLADHCQAKGGPRSTVGALALLAILSIPGCLFAFAHQAWLACALLLVLATLTGAAATMGMTLFTVLVPEDMRGLAMSVLFAANILFGIGLAPLLVSLVSGLLGGPSTIGPALGLMGSASNSLAAASFVIARRKLRHMR